MSKEKWYEEEHQKDAAMVYDLLAKSQFAVEYQSRDAIEAEYVARKAILDRFESLRKPAGRERGEEGAGLPGNDFTRGYLRGAREAVDKMLDSASAEPQRAFGPIREALSQLEIAAGALREIQGDHESRYNAIALLHLLKAKSALLGEALPTSGEAEQSEIVASERPETPPAGHNQATPGATVQPQADARLDAAKRLAEYFYHNLNQGKAWCVARDYLQDGVLPVAEPIHKGSAQ